MAVCQCCRVTLSKIIRHLRHNGHSQQCVKAQWAVRSSSADRVTRASSELPHPHAIMNRMKSSRRRGDQVHVLILTGARGAGQACITEAIYVGAVRPEMHKFFESFSLYES